MNTIKRAIGAAAVLALAIPMVRAQDAVGYVKITAPASSDVVLTVPFTSDPAGAYTVASVPSASTLAVSQSLPAGTFDTSHYLRLTSGTGNGLWSTISANASGELTLADADILDYVNAGDSLEVYTHQTLESVFPAGMKGISMLASEKGGLFFTHYTQVLLYDEKSGINKASDRTYFFYSGAWRKTGEAESASFNDTVLAPESFFVLRNLSAATDLVFLPSGTVPSQKMAAEFASGVENDYLLSTGRPTSVTLDELNLGGTAAFEDSVQGGLFVTKTDTLLVYDNSNAANFNPAAERSYYYLDGAWRKSGAATTEDFGSDIINPGEAFTIRKSTSGSGVHLWSASAPY